MGNVRYYKHVEYRAGMTLAAQATTHHRALRGMEARDGTAGNADKQEREYGSGLRLRMRVAQSLPHFGQQVTSGHLHVEHDQQARGHEEQGKGKERINLAYDGVDGKNGRQHVVGENHDYPESDVASQ